MPGVTDLCVVATPPRFWTDKRKSKFRGLSPTWHANSITRFFIARCSGGCRITRVNSTRQTGLALAVYPDYERLSRAAAEIIISHLRQKPDLLLCAATGASPTRIYQLLVEEFRREPDAFRNLRVLKLDEWGGLAMDDPGSCEFYLQQHLLKPLAISAERYAGAQSDARFPEKECARIRQWLQENGPIDICVLGLGHN